MPTQDHYGTDSQKEIVVPTEGGKSVHAIGSIIDVLAKFQASYVTQYQEVLDQEAVMIANGEVPQLSVQAPRGYTIHRCSA